MGIHYDYKSTKGNKLMEKQAKREKKLADKKAKREAKEGPRKEPELEKVLDASKPITLDFLTNPDKEWTAKKKMTNWVWHLRGTLKKEKFFKKNLKKKVNNVCTFW